MRLKSRRAVLTSIILGLCFVLSLEVGFVVHYIFVDNGIYKRNLNLGHKYLLDMNYEEAIKAFSKAIEIDDMDAGAYIGRGDAYKSMGDYKSAWSDYEHAQELSGDNSILDDKIGQSELRVSSSSGGLSGASVMLSGDTHSYEFQTDEEGYLRQTLYPENYRVTVDKEDYLTVETELSAESGGVRIDDIFMEAATVPFTYDALNDFMNGGYSSAISYQPLTYALIDIDKNGIPELIFSFPTEYNETLNTQMVNYEVFRYDETDGRIKSAGQLTESRAFYSIYYSDPYPGLFTYDRTSGSHIDYVYEFDGEHMNWIFNSGWERSGGPYQYEVFLETPDGRVSKGVYPLGEYIPAYEEIGPAITLELTMRDFDNASQFNLSEQDVLN